MWSSGLGAMREFCCCSRPGRLELPSSMREWRHSRSRDRFWISGTSSALSDSSLEAMEKRLVLKFNANIRA